MIANSDTEQRTFGLLGHNIQYTLSPRIHEAIFRRIGVRASYSVVDVNPENFASSMEHMLSHYDGFNITKPYKSAAAKMVEHLGREAVKCGNINTVFKETGYNTDYTALLSIFRSRYAHLGGKKCIIFGSGSAAMTSAVAFGEMGYQLIIACRNSGSGHAIVDHLNKLDQMAADVIDLASMTSVETDVAVNTISSGDFVFPKIKCGIAVNFNYGERGKNFYDSVMFSHGTITGEDILLEQAIQAQTIWTGTRAMITWEEIFND